MNEKKSFIHIRWNITLPAAAEMLCTCDHLRKQLDRKQAHDLTYRWNFNTDRNEVTSETDSVTNIKLIVTKGKRSNGRIS